jgi:hypothetical protein
MPQRLSKEPQVHASVLIMTADSDLTLIWRFDLAARGC